MRGLLRRLDGDNDLDLAVANSGDGSISVFRNIGNGTFEPKVDYLANYGPGSVFCADMDNDGDRDLVVTNGYRVAIFKNNGNGTFANRIDYHAGSGTSAVYCADLDGDTDLDMVVTNWNSEDLTILMNKTLSPPNQPPDPFSLVSPANDGIILLPSAVNLDWETAFDPDAGNVVSYDLYVSTSKGFHPDSTSLYPDLSSSQYALSAGTGTYYWKVLAYDQQQYERWSTQIWDFTVAPQSGLLGYWKLDEGAGEVANDSSVFKNNGALLNGASWVSGGVPPDKAIGLDGVDDYVEIEDAPSLRASSAITVASWVKMDDAGGGHPQTICAKWYEPDHGWVPAYWLGFDSDNARPYFQIFSGGSTYGPAAVSDTSISVGKWAHIVGTYDGTELKIFLNGRLVGDSLFTGDINTCIAPLVFGTSLYCCPNQYLKGSIDLVKIYGRALSSQEIESEFEQGLYRGDASGDGTIDISDAVYLIAYIFSGGLAPDPLASGDANCDGSVDISDAVYLIAYIFGGGPAPGCE